LQEEAGIEVELLAGSGGVFKVTADGREIFSKFKAKRFPEPGEIASLLKTVRT
jgi:selT/selW/selH-like putative selenoprotein